MRWQEPFCRTVLQRDRVVLSAPTGAGKTAAAIAPFVAGRKGGFADRCLYALPMRTLARSLFEEYAPELAACGLEATLQMGGASLDPDYRGDVIFTTIDQLLSRYLNAPYGGRPANISAGALVGAHIVLDEFHLYPEDEARLTSITMLDHLKGLSSAVVMTATLPDAARSVLTTLLDASDFTVSAQEMDASGDRPRPRRSWLWCEQALNASAAIATWEQAGQPQRILICTNTVARAQALFRDLRDSLPSGHQIVLVHARFLPRDRDRHETTARSWLGKTSEQRTSWIVATQVIEAGLDASADLLLTELAPASSLVQRAGRCARWPRPQSGTVPRGVVVVFRDPELHSFRPYEAEVVEATWSARQDVDFDAGAEFEAELLATAHGLTDFDTMRRLRSRLPSRRKTVFEAIDSPDPSIRWQLVRNVSSQAVLVRQEPTSVDLARMPDTVSVAASSLWPLLSNATSLAGAYVPAPNDAEAEPTHETAWGSPRTVNAAIAAPVLLLTPRLADYDGDIGLTLGVTGAETPLQYNTPGTSTRQRFVNHKNVFEAHIGQCVLHARKFLERSAAAIARLSWSLSVAPNDIEACILLAVALHDTGKLTETWQAWATEHQRVLHGDIVQRCIAHTDYDPFDSTQRDRSRTVRPTRPRHAVEGAVLAREIVEQWLSDRGFDDAAADAIERAVLGAIARHHSAHASRAEVCQVDPRARGCIERALRAGGHSPDLTTHLGSGVDRVSSDLDADGHLPSTRHAVGPIEVMLYASVARLVRLADQHSFDAIPPRSLSG